MMPRGNGSTPAEREETMRKLLAWKEANPEAYLRAITLGRHKP